ncbi:Rrf2 family transcriptional regulator [Clostridium sp. AM58-1XD]|uniref:RrF2 family transcriptional regulator n=1 Tax=Clostridium sp. AM58-1XD TaxID=2292307 RepID=UPI000E474CBF|nr:Rrf2 family transcriptional regulator [Clostridium sp. AM58-1XD]RGY99234.1 transcriptional regulator [Clostridium sp. AM58-1XD]
MTSEFTVAVHALVFLNHKKAITSSEALAKNVCTNPARIRKIMSRLKKAGLTETKEGIDGGYLFSKDAEKVNLCMVADALDIPFVSASWKSGDPHMECLIASGMDGVMTDIYHTLDCCCREKLKQITVADIDRKLFNSKSA